MSVSVCAQLTDAYRSASEQHTLAKVIGTVQVAFSSFTSVGPIMAIAIAVHNIPEVMVLFQNPLQL